MFANWNSDFENLPFYWTDWTGQTQCKEEVDASTLGKKRRKTRRCGKNVSAESQVVPPAPSWMQDPESPVETVSHSAESHSEMDMTARKKQIMRENNKYASRKCRQLKKEYVKGLEERVASLENHNKTLMEELKLMKEVLQVRTGFPAPANVESDN